ncbi:hypothetical protein HanRHA438_Chr17g0812641 [Helianthus annuus]|nr:hypothetical protein HanRHA438_Chr17g0812641 [Helianthus annuus]
MGTVPLKVNFLVWRIYLGWVVTMAGLCRRNVHLVVGCQFALAVWDFIAEWTRCPRLFAFTVN